MCKRSIRFTLLFLVSLGTVGLCGCSLGDRKAAAELAAQDQRIESRIHQLLAGEPILESAPLEVHSVQGVVELTGKVASRAAKSRAGLIAASVPGVAQVHNDLLVTSAGEK